MAEAVDVCSLPVAGNALCSAVGAVADPVGTIASKGTDEVGKWLVGGVTHAGTSLISSVDKILDATTTPNLAASWFVQNYNVVFGIAFVVVAITFMIQIISSLIRREPGMLGRAVSGSAIGVIGGFAILAVCQIALVATDQLSAGMLTASGGTSVGDSLSKTFASSMGGMTGVNWLLGVLLGLLFVIGVIMLWITMFLREIAIYVLAVFAPIAFAGYGWDRTRTWLRRWGEIVAALIFSKLVIYIIFILGLSMLGGAGTGGTGGVSDLLGGACLLIMSAFAPWATHRFISFAGDAAQDVHAHTSPGGHVAGPAIAAGAATMAVGSKVATTVVGGVTGGPVGAAAGAASPSGGKEAAQGLATAGGTNSGGSGGGGEGAGSPGSSSLPAEQPGAAAPEGSGGGSGSGAGGGGSPVGPPSPAPAAASPSGSGGSAGASSGAAAAAV